jgi:imidazoleglycerol-phosphate dehydratase
MKTKTPRKRPSAAPRARSATVERATRETKIRAALALDGRPGAPQRVRVRTGVGFLDHMVTALATHGGFDLDLRARGDLHVDAHHTVEDVGIVLGRCLREALGDKRGIARFGHAFAPLDEALTRAVVDLSGRPWLHFGVEFKARTIGDMPTELFEDFFWAFVDHGRFNLHLDVLRGRNSHHIAETLFKSTARALRDAVARDGAAAIPSTKGAL